MGACQNQFHNVPDLESNAQQLEKQRQRERFTSNSIKLPHKTCKPNQKQINIGMIDSKINANSIAYRNTSPVAGSKNPYQSLVPLQRTSLQEGIINEVSSVKSAQNQMQQANQINREELHQTMRPFGQQQYVSIPKEETNKFEFQEKQKKQLNLDFFYSLALPEYAYPAVPQKYSHEYQSNVQLREQVDRNGVKYVGQWKNQQIHGNGVLKSNTLKYIGQFRNGLKHFHGRQIQSDEVYEGQFNAGRRKGKGIRFTPQCIQQGQFDEFMTKGVISYNNGDTYEGELKNNKYHGFGKLIEAYGEIIYEGQYRNGKLHGRGRITYKDGKQYDGQFEDGLKHGEGRFQWDEQNWYQGQYRKGKKHGKGMLLRNGTYYEGNFKNGKMNGKILVYTMKEHRRQNEKIENYENGMRIVDEEDSFLTSNDELPDNWRKAVS